MGEESKKQNILIVHNYYQIPGGEDTVVANEKKMLEKHGHKVTLYSRNNAELKKMPRLRKIFLPITTVFNPRTYRDIKKLIKQENIEVVHVHNTLNLVSPAVYYAARRMKVPVVQTIHNFRLLCPGATFYRDGHICEDCVEHGLKCAVRHSCYRESKIQTLACVLSTEFHRMTGIYGKINYICLTDFNKKKLLELKQIKPERVFVKPNFVECKNEFVSEKDRMNQFVFAGRLDKLKGIDSLLKHGSVWEHTRLS
ncbi:MAG: glycosyltransferase [Mediterraneibacter faecis]